jgi:hypothetical protein
MKKIQLTLFIALLLNNIAYADTKMVIETPEGILTTWSNDKYFRAGHKQNLNSTNPPGPEGDMLGLLKSRKMYMIMDKEKILIDMSNPMPFSELSNMSSRPKIKISYVNKRKGEFIAGLKTTKYDLMARGKKCFEIYVTKNNAYNKTISDFNSLDSNDGDAQGDLCEQIETQQNPGIDKQYGYPVKMIDRNGKVTMLLKKFETNVTAPKKHLALPKGYQVMTMMDAMSKAMKDGTINKY